MAFLNGLMRWGFALFLALAFGQLPEFAQQYEQRLGGAVVELRAIVTRFDEAATKAGLSRDEALAAYASSSESFLRTRGTDMAAVLSRYLVLQSHLDALQSDGPVMRYADLLRYYDQTIAMGTLEAYRPAIPTTQEGLAMAGIGAVLGFGGGALVGAGLRRRRPRAT